MTHPHRQQIVELAWVNRWSRRGHAKVPDVEGLMFHAKGLDLIAWVLDHHRRWQMFRDRNSSDKTQQRWQGSLFIAMNQPALGPLDSEVNLLPSSRRFQTEPLLLALPFVLSLGILCALRLPWCDVSWAICKVPFAEVKQYLPMCFSASSKSPGCGEDCECAVWLGFSPEHLCTCSR